jgi:hypothetical protein
MVMAEVNSKGSGLWGIPASVSLYGKNFVVISGPGLSKRLEELYTSGVREVEVVVDVPGQRLVASGRIYNRYNKQRNATYYYIYPRDPAQRLLRELYYKYRGNAPIGAKRPMVAVVVAIIPREGV